MEEELINIIKDVTKYKIDLHIRPLSALFIADIMPEIKVRVQKTLEKLVSEGRVHHSPTVSDDAFTINE